MAGFSLFISLGIGFCPSIMFLLMDLLLCIVNCVLKFDGLLAWKMLYICVFGIESYAYTFVIPSFVVFYLRFSLPFLHWK